MLCFGRCLAIAPYPDPFVAPFPDSVSAAHDGKNVKFSLYHGQTCLGLSVGMECWIAVSGDDVSGVCRAIDTFSRCGGKLGCENGAGTENGGAERAERGRERRGAGSGGSGERRGAENGGSGGAQGTEGTENGGERRTEGTENGGERRTEGNEERRERRTGGTGNGKERRAEGSPPPLRGVSDWGPEFGKAGDLMNAAHNL
eukprot:gene8836-biopygen4549